MFVDFQSYIYIYIYIIIILYNVLNSDVACCIVRLQCCIVKLTMQKPEANLKWTLNLNPESTLVTIVVEQ